MSDYNGGLRYPNGPSSSLVDYSERMKPKDANDADWELFFNKYSGLIISRCKNWDNENNKGPKKHCWHLNDEQTQDIIGLVYKKMYDGSRLEYHKSAGSFHGWFKTLIDNIIIEYLRKCYAQKRGRDKEGNNLLVSLEAQLQLPEEKATENYLPPSCSLNEEDYLAMLAWEEVCEKSKNPKQRLFFSWSTEGITPAEIAPKFGIDPTEVSELIRQFKNKLITAYRKLGKSIDSEKLDWADVIKRAGEARKRYDAIVDEFFTGAGEYESR